MKRIYSILLTLCVSCTLFAQLSIWNGSSDIWTKGAGTEASPFLIESAEQLAFISDMVNGGVTTYKNTYFKLMTNIDLGRDAWVSMSFDGNFDGNNYTIVYHGEEPVFGGLGGTIKRLNVESTNGFAKNVEGTIMDCKYKGNNSMVQKAQYSNFINCVCIVEIPEFTQKGNYLGGVANEANECNFISCRISGNIVGSFNEDITTWTYGNTDAYRKCNIFAAGLVALSQKCEYNQCVSNTNVRTEGVFGRRFEIGSTTVKMDAYAFAGGLIGLTVEDTIQNSQTRGTILEEHNGNDGGLIGIQSNYDENKISTISNTFTLDTTFCYKVKYGALARLDKILIGDWSSETGSPILYNCYCSKNKTEASMKSASFPIILNTDSTV